MCSLNAFIFILVVVAVNRSDAKSNDGSIFDLLPKTPDCGQSVEKNLDEDTQTMFQEFPWTAYIIDVEGQYACTGSLINSRYILTTAYCIIKKQVTNVQFGQFNTTTDIDYENENNTTFNNSKQILDIEEVIIHEMYNINFWFSYDIGLIRLKEDVNFNTLVQPICLPSGVDRIWPIKESPILTISGWKNTLYPNGVAMEKQKLSVSFVNQKNCAKIYYNIIRLCESVFCGKTTENTRIICKDFTGAPVMQLTPQGWILQGIVSFGLRSSCSETRPNVFTKVSTYDIWIKSNLK